MQPVIEKGIPIPPKPGSQRDWLLSLEHGDSFKLKSLPMVQSYVSNAKRYGVILRSRKLSEGGYRLWRDCGVKVMPIIERAA